MSCVVKKVIDLVFHVRVMHAVLTLQAQAIFFNEVAYRRASFSETYVEKVSCDGETLAHILKLKIYSLRRVSEKAVGRGTSNYSN